LRLKVTIVDAIGYTVSCAVGRVVFAISGVIIVVLMK